MRSRTILSLLVAAAIACSAVPASAQQVSLTIENGLVNLDASNASLRQILEAWSRVGGTTIVNADQVMGEPVTLKLVNQPEREALAIILRSVAGYMAAPRAASAAPGASMYDRIMVLPTSTAPKAAAVRAPGPDRQGGLFRGPFDRNGAAGMEAEEPPVFTFPDADGGMEQAQPYDGANGMTGTPSPFGQPVPGPSPFGQPAAPAFDPSQQPGGAFGQPQQTPFGQPQQTPFGQPQPTPTPFGQPQPTQQTPFGQIQPTVPFGQPAQQTPFGQIQPAAPINPQVQPSGQGQTTPIVNPFAAALGLAQPQPQTAPAPPAPAPGTFTIIGSPTPGVVSQPQQPTTPPRPFGKPPGQ